MASKNFEKLNKDEKVVISKRIKDTRQEIENLNADLERLISTGQNLCSSARIVNNGDKENVIETKNAVQIIKPYDNKPSVSSENIPKSNKSIAFKSSKDDRTSEVSCRKKIKPYNVDEAREYMKKQKEKRVERQKIESKDNVNHIELKKQKLQELHLKSLQLVAKNVEAKRERSKSRDPQGALRIDRTVQRTRSTDKPNNATRGKSCDKQGSIQDTKIQPAETETVQLPQERQSRNRTRARTDKINYLSRTSNELGKIKISQNISVPSKAEENMKNYLSVPHAADLQVTFRPPLENITTRSFNSLSLEPFNEAVNQNSSKETHSASNDLAASSHSIKEKNNENSNNEEKLIVDAPQINKIEFPSWLQEKPPTPSPLNFINTVKRRLLYVVNTPKTTADIGVQNSFKDFQSETPELNPKSKSELRENLERSVKNKPPGLKTFVSHINLDPRPIQHLELVSRKSAQNAVRQESESDTSKNIPDISSESSSSQKQKAITVEHASENDETDRFHITTKNLDKLKLETRRLKRKNLKDKSSSSTSSTLKTEPNSKHSKNMKKSSSNSDLSSSQKSNIYSNRDNFSGNKINVTDKSQGYSMTFGSNLDDTLDERLLVASRESILSYNNSAYSTTPNCSNAENHSSKTDIQRIAGNSDRSIPSTSKNKEKTSSIIPTETNINGHSSNIPKSSNDDHSNFKSLFSDLYPSEDTSNTKINSRKDKSISQILTEPSEQISKSNSLHSSITTNERISKMRNPPDLELPNLSTRSSGKISIEPLKEPSISLKIVDRENNYNLSNAKAMKNLTLRNKTDNFDSTNRTNEIHLKFEAEIHLLNDFNESLRQLSAAEQAYQTLKTKNEPFIIPKKVLQNRDTQTSIVNSITSSPSIRIHDDTIQDDPQSQISSINDSTVSDLFNNGNIILPGENEMFHELDDSSNYSALNISNQSSVIEKFSNCESLTSNKFAGLSLRMFEQLIKDEDLRLDNLKTILKIREHALLDRTKGELTYLEMQKKYLKETGKLAQASLIKKKQRGIIMKHQQERQEMQRLKQMQRAASNERKIILKEQRNLIKAQLSTDSMLSKMKVNSPRDRRQSGPLKVFQSHSESVRSETSISRKSSGGEEVLSITSHSHSVISKVSDVETNQDITDNQMKSNNSIVTPLANMKRTLLMREADLQKRRKAAEDLLQWHRKLLDEEKRIAELEQMANKIISQLPNTMSNSSCRDVTEKYHFNGAELNQIWQNLTGNKENKFSENKSYPMSQIAFDRFCKSAREYSTKTKKILKLGSGSVVSSEKRMDDSISETSDIPNIQNSEISDKTVTQNVNKSVIESALPTASEYTSEFDMESNETENVNHSKISTITQLIDNFSKIQEEISSISQKTRKSTSRIETRRGSNSLIDLLRTEGDQTISEKSVKSVSDLVQVFSQSKSDDEENKNSLKSLEEVEVKSITITEEVPEIDNKSSVNNTAANEINVFETKTSTSLEDLSHLGTEENLSESIKSAIDVANENQNIKSSSLVSDQSLKHSTKDYFTILHDEELEPSNTITEENSEINDSNSVEKSSNKNIPETNHSSNSRIQEIVTVEDFSNKTLSKLSDQVSHQTIPTEDDSIIKEASDIIAKEIAEESIITQNDCENENSRTNEILEELFSNKVFSTSLQEISKTDNDINRSSISKEFEDQKQTPSTKSEENQLERKFVADEKTSAEISYLSTEDTPHQEYNRLDELSYGVIDKKKSECSDDVNSETIASRISNTLLSDVEEISDKIHSEIQMKNEKTSQTISLGDNTKDETITSKNVSTDLSHLKSNENDVIISKDEDSKTSEITDNKEVNSFEEKEQDSLSITSESTSHQKSNKEASQKSVSVILTKSSISEEYDSSQKSSISTEKLHSLSDCEKKSSQSPIDVKKRVSEIMADAGQVSRGDKSPRLQDLYITTYDLVSPTHSPESGSPKHDSSKKIGKSLFGNEAEELLRKQLAIEQEIKQLEQQQKEIPYVFMREIPNKPPPPYKPPTATTTKNITTVIPKNPMEIDEITKYSAKILHKAYISNNLNNITISDNTLNLITKNVNKECYKFIFDLCKEFAKEHYKQFEKKIEPSWLTTTKRHQVAVVKPLDAVGLEKYMNKKLKESFGFKKMEIRENAIIRWSRKKRDHVDEILVLESQAEESEWINYDKDELLVIDDITNHFIKNLLSEAADVFSKNLAKTTYFS